MVAEDHQSTINEQFTNPRTRFMAVLQKYLSPLVETISQHHKASAGGGSCRAAQFSMHFSAFSPQLQPWQGHGISGRSGLHVFAAEFQPRAFRDLCEHLPLLATLLR